MRTLIQSVLKRFGYRIQALYDSVIDKDAVFMAIYEKCRPFTMTPKERQYALYKAMQYILNAGIAGDFVECGVWKGGSVMVIAETLKRFGVEDRRIWLYDTFEGMSDPTKEDVHVEDSGITALHGSYDPSIGTLDEVKANLLTTEYPFHLFKFVQGMVEETIPTWRPQEIALLRLDTDWYESTKHELYHLWPRLRSGGVLIIDDYGAWAGAKKAVDEYFWTQNILLNRIDRDSRIAQKP